MQLFIKLGDIFREIRWNQWFKGFFAFFALLWVPHAWGQYASLVLAGAIAFNFTSSIVYIINDFRDIGFDKKHPVKKLRPLVAGKLTNLEAFSLMVMLAGLVLVLVGIIGNATFTLLLLSYLLLNLFYTYVGKHIPYLDIFFLALFASMRVVAGFVLIQMPIAWYFVGVIFTLYVFAMSVQRLAEVSVANIEARPVIKHYSPKILKFIMTVFLMITVMLYFMAMSIVALPLVYTDALYFLVLLAVHEYMNVSETKKAIAEDGYSFLLHNKKLLTLAVLFILALIVLVVWYY